jgi:hypothetical protein
VHLLTSDTPAQPHLLAPLVFSHFVLSAVKLTIKGVEHFVFPSTELLKPKERSGGFLPDDAKTPTQITAFLTTWAKEYALLERLLNTLCPQVSPT